MKQIQWYFPPTGGGVEYNFNDGSQEHFRDDPLNHTLREVIQNSLDALDAKGFDSIAVAITETTVPSNVVGADTLALHIEKSLERSTQYGIVGGVEFYKRALEILKQQDIRVLSIIDRNTTGLTEDKWNALIYNEGTPVKTGMPAAGGSFGIGKNAPYLLSSLGLVCYSTRYLDLDGRRGRIEKFIARAKLSAHSNPHNPVEILQHVGFGTIAPWTQRTNPPSPTLGNDISSVFRLDEPGTGIFIMGFDPGQSDWARKTEMSIAYNFFAAIHHRKLQVTIKPHKWPQPIVVSNETLDSIFQYGEQKERAQHYYYAIRDDAVKPIKTVKLLGKSFRIFMSITEEAPRRVAYINRRGMLITDHGQFGKNPFTVNGNSWMPYAAVVIASDDSTDEYIRRMEPPNHENIEYRSIRDFQERTRIEKELREIRDAISDIIEKETRSKEIEHDINLTELSDILPRYGDEDHQAIVLKHRTLTHSNRNENQITFEDGPTIETDEDSQEQQADDSHSTKISQNSNRPAIHTIYDVRIIRSEPDTLIVAFTPHHAGDQSICLSIKPAGEERRREDHIPIVNVTCIRPDNASVQLTNNVVKLNTQPGERVVLQMIINANQPYTGYTITEHYPYTD